MKDAPITIWHWRCDAADLARDCEDRGRADEAAAWLKVSRLDGTEIQELIRLNVYERGWCPAEIFANLGVERAHHPAIDAIPPRRPAKDRDEEIEHVIADGVAAAAFLEAADALSNAAEDAGNHFLQMKWLDVACIHVVDAEELIRDPDFRPGMSPTAILAIAERIERHRKKRERRAEALLSNSGQEPKRLRGLGRATMALRKTILAVLEEIPGPVSARQVHYRCVSLGATDNNRKSLRRVLRCVLEMRRDGSIPYSRIVDRRRRSHKRPGWDGARDLMQQAATQYRRDLWDEQDVVVHIACEKAALEGIFAEACDEYGAALYVTQGFNSESFEYEWSEDIRELNADGKRVEIVYFGDHDPSGLCLEHDARKRLERFGVKFTWRRAGLLHEDFARFDLVNVPVKATDSRAKRYLSQFGDRAAELDALSPVELRQRIASAITAVIDVERWNHLDTIASAERESLEMVAKHWDVAVNAARTAA